MTRLIRLRTSLPVKNFFPEPVTRNLISLTTLILASSEYREGTVPIEAAFLDHVLDRASADRLAENAFLRRPGIGIDSAMAPWRRTGWGHPLHHSSC